MLLSPSHSSTQVFAAFMLAAVTALAAPPGMSAHSPILAHVHAVVGHILLRHGHLIHRVQDLAVKLKCSSSARPRSAVSMSEDHFGPWLIERIANYKRMQHMVTTRRRRAHRMECAACMACGELTCAGGPTCISQRRLHAVCRSEARTRCHQMARGRAPPESRHRP